MAVPNSSSSLTLVRSYDVFPNFHGSDVRRGFLSHLRYHFASKGIRMFNDQEITRGRTIGPDLVQAIEESMVSIVVLSKNYASSSWCLDELVEIFKCKETFGQIVMTIFYEVDPSDVRKQKGDFGKAFEKACEGKTEEVKQTWTKALEDVATIAGEHSLNWANEIEMIQKIATDVSNVKSIRYDVFPSYRGTDVRKRFLSHLLYHFASKGIRTFHDQEINRGQDIGPKILQAIKESRLSIVVFSENYATSSWCLDELVAIIKCKENSGQIVMPIFYDVDPSEVRKQRGDFGKAFEKTCKGKTEELKERWRHALSHVANLVGYYSPVWENEAEMIQKIAMDVSQTLNTTRSRGF